MFLLKDYLTKFKKITPPDEVVREKTRELLEEKLGLVIPKEKITVRNKVVFIESSGSVKAAIFLQKNFLLKGLKESLGDKSPNDIR